MDSSSFLAVAAIVALGTLIWDCVEVGRNDAANLVNAVFGSRVMSRRNAVWMAGLAVIVGAGLSSDVMETARKGIFSPEMLTIETAIIVYITVYIVDTLLLYTYSAFGMPVSTTASLVFELVGASIGVALTTTIVNWDKVGQVIAAIVYSILLSGLAGFLIQRAFRGAIRNKAQDHLTILVHGPWIAGLMLSWLTWFMLVKGLKNIAIIQSFQKDLVDAFGIIPVLLVIWGGYTLVIHLYLIFTGERGSKGLFGVTAVVGMCCMAFAFGQNDLANCASPGLSALWLWKHQGDGIAMATEVAIPVWALFGCGLLMVIGMTTKNAQRVTRAAVNTGSQFDRVALYAPNWCQWLARKLIRPGREDMELAPQPEIDENAKKIHFDTLRASVITGVCASVIAFASSRGLPVSTTYVAFAAVITTGWADRALTRGDSDLKIGRAIWVIFSWFFGALLAMVSSALLAVFILWLWKMGIGVVGLAIGLAGNIAIRFFVKKRSNQHEQIHHEAASKRIREDQIDALKRAKETREKPEDLGPPGV